MKHQKTALMVVVFEVSILVSLTMANLMLPVSAGLTVETNISNYGSVIEESVNAYGYLHTDGRWIKDSNGNIVRLGGFNTYIRLYHEKAKFQNAKAAGADYIRLMFWKSEIENPQVPTQWEIDNKVDKTGLAAIDKAVAWCKEVGLQLILDEQCWTEGLDSAPGSFLNDPTLQLQWLNMWRTIVDRYKNDSVVVGIDLMNEPYILERNNIPAEVTDPEGAWETIAKDAVNDLKTHNPNLLFIIEDFGGSNRWRDIQFLKQANIVYSDHKYYHYNTWIDWGQAYVAGNLVQAKQLLANWVDTNWMVYPNQGIPLWIGEIGAISTDPNYLVQIDDMMTILDDRTVGYSGYTYMAIPWNEPFDLIDRTQPPENYVLTDVGSLVAQHLVNIT